MYSYFKENRVKVLLFPLIAYWILLFIATTIPSDNFSDVLQIGDKLKHFFAYYILAFLLSLNLHFQEKWKKLAVSAFIYSFFITTIYGAVDEIHQILVPNRSAEFLDWVADMLGSLSGVISSLVFIKYLKKRRIQAET